MQPQPAQYFDPNAQAAKQRKLIMIAAILGVLGLVFVGLNAIFGGESSTEKLGLVLARQQALVAVLEEDRNSQDAGQSANLAAQTAILLTGSSQELTDAGVAPTKNQVAQTALPDAAELLAQARQEGRYGEAVTELISQIVSANQADLDTLLPDIKNEQLRQIVEQLILNNQSILAFGS